MSSSKNKSDPEEKTAPQIYLIMDLNRTESPEKDLESVLKITPVASILIKNNAPAAKLNKNLIESIQAHNIAVLIEDDLQLCQNLNADGIHLNETDEQTFHQILSETTEDFIIGVTADRSRHKAMVLAEAGCSYMAIKTDYLENQTSQQTSLNDEIEEFAKQPEIDWWVFMFATPCVAWNIDNIETAHLAAEDDADFVALKPEFWQSDNRETNLTELIKAITPKPQTLES